MPVSEATYLKLAEEDFEGGWELVCGQLRRKPGMTMRHNSITSWLTFELQVQLPRDQFKVSHNSARVRLHGGTHYIPDVVVVPFTTMTPHWEETGVEAYPEALPLVVEVWSPATGEYDVESKVQEYQLRGDAEIWRIDPRDRSVTIWVRQANGPYLQRRYTRGLIHLSALVGVSIDVREMFRYVGL